MKKQFYVIMSIILPNLVFAQGLTTHTFFDFNTFEEQIQESYPNPDNQLISVDGEAVAELGTEMFLLENWLVDMKGSAAENAISQRDSYSKRITSAEQGTVLGIRARFPDWSYANEVHISPKFPLLPFTQDGAYANLNNGVVTNVGSVKSFSMWANGRNFPFTVGVRLADMRGKVREYGLGSLLFIGWRKLVNKNPFFSDRAVNNIRPNTRIYPSDIPLLTFQEIVVYKPANTEGKDFIGYFGNMDIEYTPYITEFPTDINDEETWGLISAEQKRQASEINGILYEEILQYEYAKRRVQTDDAGQDGEAGQDDTANQDAAQ